MPAPGFSLGIQEEVGLYFPEFRKAPMIAERPVFGTDGRELGRLALLMNTQKQYLEAIYLEGKGACVPLLFWRGRPFLRDALAKSEESARIMTNTRLGQEGRIDPALLVRGGPLHYWARIGYSRNEKPVGSFLFDLMSQKVEPTDWLWDEPSDGKRRLEARLPEIEKEARKVKLLASVPDYSLYLSDRATCLGMMLGYWANQRHSEWIQTRASENDRKGNTGNPPPRDWIKEIDLLGKGCFDCQSIEKTVELFSQSRGLPVTVRAFDGKALEGSRSSFRMIQDLVDRESYPFLLEDKASRPFRYAVGIGYLVAGGWPFVACLIPSAESIGGPWQEAFLNWEFDFEHFRIFQMMPLEGKVN